MKSGGTVGMRVSRGRALHFLSAASPRRIAPPLARSAYSAPPPPAWASAAPICVGALCDSKQAQSKCVTSVIEALRANDPERPHFPCALELVCVWKEF